MNQVQQFIEYISNAFKIWVIIQPWEQGLRVRNGKRIKRLKKGIYFKIPYFDSVYVQEVRLRVRDMPIQTVTSKDGVTITLNSAIGYSITNLEKLYQTLYMPDVTLQNIAMSANAEIIATTNASEITPQKMESEVLKKLRADDYGLSFEYFKITSYAVVKTFRLIQDQTWTDDGFTLDKKK